MATALPPIERQPLEPTRSRAAHSEPQKARHRARPHQNPVPMMHADSMLAAGFLNEQQMPPLVEQQASGNLQPHPPVDAKPAGIGDPSSAALNAAALQQLSLKAAEQHYHRYRGRILVGNAGKLLDGVKSHDVSYIADRRGGNRRVQEATGSQAPEEAAAAALAVVKALAAHLASSSSSSSSILVWALRGAAPKRLLAQPFPPRSSSSSSSHLAARRAVATADQLRRSLLEMMESKGAEAIGTEDETEEMELWNNAFGEVVRQVYVHCNERGHLLEAIRQKYVALLNRLMSGSRTQLRRCRPKPATTKQSRMRETRPSRTQ